MNNKLSYNSTPRKSPYIYATVLDMLDHWANTQPDNDAFVEYTKNGERKPISCKELRDLSLNLGKYLVKSGIRKGDLIVLCMSNSLEMLITQFGVIYAGGITICSTTNLVCGSDVITLLKDSNAKLLVIDADPLEQSWQITQNVLNAKTSLPLQNIVINAPAKSSFWDRSTTFLKNVIDEKVVDDAVRLPDVFPEDLIIYFKTSGTTGKPKMIGHTHFSYINNSLVLMAKTGITKESIYFCDRPFGWSGGFPRTFITSGATRVFVDTRLSIQGDMKDTIGDIILTEQCTHMYMPCYLVTDILNRPDMMNKFASIKTIILAGEKVLNSCRQLIGKVCQHLCIWYGSSEAAGVSTYTSDDTDSYADGIIGIPLPGFEMKIVDESGRVIPKGQHGEILVRSNQTAVDFLGMPERFHQVLDSANWFHTDDIGYMRPDGCMVMEGRRTDKISIGTEKIYPYEIEKELILCPGVSSALVIAVPDKRLHNVICACVVFDEKTSCGIDDVKIHCDKTWVDKRIGLGRSLKPKYFLQFDRFSSTANGKVDKREVTKEAFARLKLV